MAGGCRLLRDRMLQNPGRTRATTTGRSTPASQTEPQRAERKSVEFVPVTASKALHWSDLPNLGEYNHFIGGTGI